MTDPFRWEVKLNRAALLAEKRAEQARIQADVIRILAGYVTETGGHRTAEEVERKLRQVIRSHTGNSMGAMNPRWDPAPPEEVLSVP